MSYWFSLPYWLLQFYCSSASYLCSLKVAVYVTRFTPYSDTGQDIQSGCLFSAPPFFKCPNQRSFGVGKLSRLCGLSTWHGKRRKKRGQSKSLFTFHCLGVWSLVFWIEMRRLGCCRPGNWNVYLAMVQAEGVKLSSDITLSLHFFSLNSQLPMSFTEDLGVVFW